MYEIKIAPSILSANFSKIGEEVVDIDRAGADVIHLDVMDGVFVKNITFGPKFIKDIRPYTNKTFDAHLMIIHPEKYVAAFIDAGADLITVHQEACGENLLSVLKLIRSLGVKCGAVINPDTPAEAIFPVLDELDVALVMSVFPGFGGQKFMESSLLSVKKLAEYREKHALTFEIEIDGGINFENVSKAKAAGANMIVAGNTVFSSPDRAEAIKKLRNG